MNTNMMTSSAHLLGGTSAEYRGNEIAGACHNRQMDGANDARTDDTVCFVHAPLHEKAGAVLDDARLRRFLQLVNGHHQRPDWGIDPVTGLHNSADQVAAHY
jgi:hypothetical protein